jgi:hypothetical protein
MQQIKHSIREVDGKYLVIRTSYTSDGQPINRLARASRVNSNSHISWNKGVYDITRGEEIVSLPLETINEAHDLITYYETNIDWAEVI